MPEPIIAPMPSAVRDHGPNVFCRRCPGDSASEISLSMDLQQKSWLSEVRTTSPVFAGGSLAAGCAKGLFSPEPCGRHLAGLRTLGRLSAFHACLGLRLAASQFLDLGLLRSPWIVAS